MSARMKEYQQKRTAVLGYMQRHGLQAILLTRRCNFAWFTAGGLNHVSPASDLGASTLVVTPERTACITSNIEAPRVDAEEISELGIETFAAPWFDPPQAARLFAGALEDRSAACDVPVAGLPATVRTLAPDFNTLRWVLTPEEVERYRTLAREAAEAFEEVCRGARPGLTEHQLAGRIAGALGECGIRMPTLLIAADERVQHYRHPIPTLRKFTRYGMAVGGAERGGLIVSLSRLFSFGQITEDLKRRHQAVCQVDAAMIAATRPGTTLGDIFEAARKAYGQTGFPDEWQFHHQGGLTGYTGREFRVLPGDRTEVKADQAFAWNPSITGTKSEDTLLVGSERNQLISQTGKWPTTPYCASGQTWPRCDILQV